MVLFSDVNYLSTNAPPAAAEWSSLLRPLRGREPEGMWNLLSIVREMYKRNDRNAVPLLEIVTEECMMCEQVSCFYLLAGVQVSHHLTMPLDHGLVVQHQGSASQWQLQPRR
jgi:hypothetical protein